MTIVGVRPMLGGRTLDTDAAHLVPLVEGWTLWRWIRVRGAGFPARGVLELAAEDLAAAADELAALDDRAAALRTTLLETINARYSPGDAAARAARQAIKRDRLPPPGQLDELEPLQALRALAETRARRQEAFEQTYSTAIARSNEALLSVATNPRFREAVLWQNRRALRTGVASLAANPHATNSGARQNQQLVASYLQRYSVKNDTIGFFGPVGWATVARERERTLVRAGQDLLTKRTVYFEHWCIDTLAQKLARDPALKPFLRPRQLPSSRIDGTVLHYHAGPELVPSAKELPLVYARLLAACDGRRTARDLAQDLLRQGLDLDDEDEVYGLLTELEQSNLCTWTLEIPTVTERPERHLRSLLEEASESARANGLADLEALEAKRDAVQAAAGNLDALDNAFADLEATFERLTGQAAVRRSGQSYAGRTLVYEDCRRGVEIELGSKFLDRLGPPLHLLLEAARWYTYRVAQHYRVALEEAFDRAGVSAMDYVTYWGSVQHLFPVDPHRAMLVARASEELQRKWAAIIPIDSHARRIALESRRIARAVREAFAAPHPGWPGARYHAPDLLIAAPSAVTHDPDDGVFVLGEFHPSVCTLHFSAQKEHPERSALVRARELDLPEVIPSQVISKERAHRADHMWVSRQDIDIEIGTTRSWRPRESVVAVASLVVERQDGALVVRDRAGRWRFDIVEFFGAHLSGQLATRFPLFAPAPHLPRISIDGLVVMREQWRVSPQELTFADEKHAPLRFAGARRWAHACGLPRYVFVKVPEEPKPVYVDFACPVYVDMFAKLVRKGSDITVGEMLPAIDQTWLPDRDGHTYTSELRVVVVDPTRWQPPSAR